MSNEKWIAQVQEHARRRQVRQERYDTFWASVGFSFVVLTVAFVAVIAVAIVYTHLQ